MLKREVSESCICHGRGNEGALAKFVVAQKAPTLKLLFHMTPALTRGDLNNVKYKKKKKKKKKGGGGGNFFLIGGTIYSQENVALPTCWSR